MNKFQKAISQKITRTVSMICIKDFHHFMKFNEKKSHFSSLLCKVKVKKKREILRLILTVEKT